MCTLWKTVVIAEDDALIRMLAADAFADAGYRVVEAEDTDDALRALRQGSVNLLFTDVNMPGEMDGLALARLVRRRWPWVHIVVASADERIGGADCRGVGVFFRKPYHLDSVLAAADA